MINTVSFMSATLPRTGKVGFGGEQQQQIIAQTFQTGNFYELLALAHKKSYSEADFEKAAERVEPDAGKINEYTSLAGKLPANSQPVNKLLPFLAGVASRL